MRSKLPAALLAMVLGGGLGGVLAGCADDGKPTSDPAWRPTATPESPSTRPADGPTRPALPDAAKKATPAGAKAFIEYYWQVVNFSQARGDVRPLRKLYSSKCTACVGVADGILDLYTRGGSLSGGTNRARVDSLSELSANSETLYAFTARVVVHHTNQVIVEADGSKDNRAAGINTFTMIVAWVDEARWRLEVLEVD